MPHRTECYSALRGQCLLDESAVNESGLVRPSLFVDHGQCLLDESSVDGVVRPSHKETPINLISPEGHESVKRVSNVMF